MKPFVALGPPSETLLTLRSGYRPLGAAMGASVVGIPSNAQFSGLDGTEIRVRAEAVATALARARAQVTERAVTLGASGVVGVDVRIAFREDALVQGPTAEVRLVGTAVLGDAPSATPFLSNLHGAELVALDAAGYRPCGLAVGYAFYSQIPGYRTSNAQGTRNAWGYKPYEHPDYTRATGQARAIAMGRLQADALASKGEGVVGVRIDPEIRAGEGGMRIDLVAVGTAVRRIVSPTLESPGVVISLGTRSA